MEPRTRRAADVPNLPQAWSVTLDDAALAITWSPSQHWLAAASASGALYLFDAVTGEEIRRIEAHRGGATVVAWHPWDDLLVSAGQDGTAKLWRIDSAEPEATLDCGKGWVEHVAWAPSGKLLATAAGRNLRLWAKNGEAVRTFSEQPNTIAGLAWSADSQRLASACYGQVVFWSPENSDPRRIFAWKGSMLSLAWSPDGRYLCHGNQDATVHFWVVAKGTELQMTGYPMKVAQLDWDRRSRYLATGGGPQIAVWDCGGKGPRGSTPKTLLHHALPVRVLRYQVDGPLLASGCAAGQIAIWHPEKSKWAARAADLGSPITSVAWCPKAPKLAAAAETGTVAAFDASGAA